MIAGYTHGPIALLLTALLLLGGQHAYAQPPPPPKGCQGGHFADFDFWLGSWTVTMKNDKLAGHNTISKEQRGCVLIERWSSAKGGSGLSINFYDTALKQWRQQWIDASSQIDIRGGLVDGAMVLEGTINDIEASSSHPFRGTWSRLADGRVRQFFEEQLNADSWTPWFEGFYKKVDAPDSGADTD